VKSNPSSEHNNTIGQLISGESLQPVSKRTRKPALRPFICCVGSAHSYPGIIRLLHNRYALHHTKHSNLLATKSQGTPTFPFSASLPFAQKLHVNSVGNICKFFSGNYWLKIWQQNRLFLRLLPNFSQSFEANQGTLPWMNAKSAYFSTSLPKPPKLSSNHSVLYNLGFLATLLNCKVSQSTPNVTDITSVDYLHITLRSKHTTNFQWN